VILAAALGTVDIGTLNVYPELVPQLLLSFTVTEPAILPAVRLIELVEVVPDPLHPVPLTVHIYAVAPDTAGTEYAADWPSQAVGSVALLGVAGTGDTVRVTDAVAITPALSTVTVYVAVVPVGVTFGEAQVVQLRPVVGAHE